MAIKQKIKGIIGEISDRYYIMRAKSVEIEKYRDSRREKIMAQKPLSNQEKAEIDKFYQENYGGGKNPIYLASILQCSYGKI